MCAVSHDETNSVSACVFRVVGIQYQTHVFLFSQFDVNNNQ